MKRISILCLHDRRTGGPEATHQLSDALLAQGFDARVVYYTPEQVNRLIGISPRDGYSFGDKANTIREYDRYKVVPASDIANAEGEIVVLSETLAHLAPLFHRATVVIWWLSVDNGLMSLSAVNLNHLRKKNVRHVCQSQYASRFIRALGFKDCGELSDYTLDMSEYAEPLPPEKRPKLCVFNANYKVIHDVKAIAEDVREFDPEIECVMMDGLERRQVAELFARARVYVDLGSFPGRDRLPREAQRMGVVPMVSACGAGREMPGFCPEGDWPKQIAAYVKSPPLWALDPLPDEKAKFFSEVRSVFDGL